MRRAILLFLFLIPSIVYAQNHAQYKNKTNEQLSGLRRGQTNITWDTFINNFFGPLNSAIQRQFKESYIIGYDYPDIHTAISAIGSNQGAITIVDSQAVTQSSRYIIPSNISIFVTDAGFLYLDKQLTINGKFYAGLSQAFKGNLDSLKFGVGSVDYIRPEWFGANGYDINDDYAALQSWVNVVENSMSSSGENLKLILGSGNWYLSDTLVIKKHNIVFECDGIIRPYGSYSGYILHFMGPSEGSQNRDEIYGSDQIWLNKIDVEKLTIWGADQAKGVIFERLDHAQIKNVLIQGTKGPAAKFILVRESDVYNMTLTRNDASSDSAVLMIYEPDATYGDITNNLRFHGLTIAYNGGTALFIDNEAAGKSRLVTFFGAQIHYLDVGQSWAALDTNVTLIKIRDADQITFIGGNLRLGQNSRGTILELGASGKTASDILLTNVRLSADADSITGIRFVDADRVIASSVIYDLPGVAAKRTSPESGITLYADYYNTVYSQNLYDISQGASAIKITTSFSGDTETPYINFIEPNASLQRRLYGTSDALVIGVEGSPNIFKNFAFSASDSSFYSASGDGVLNIGKIGRRLRSIGLAPLTSEPVDKYVGMIVYADGVLWNPGSGAGLYYYDGTSWNKL